MDGPPEEADSSSGDQGSVLARVGLTLELHREPNTSPETPGSVIDLAALACLPPTSSLAGSPGCPDGEAQRGAVLPARNEELTAHGQDDRSYDAMSATHSPSTSQSIVGTSCSWRQTEQPSDSLTRLRIAARRSPSPSQEKSSIRRGGRLPESSFLSRSTRAEPRKQTKEPSDSLTRLRIAARRSPLSSQESSSIR